MRSIGPKISDRHYEMLADLTRFFEGQRPAIERAIEETHTKYITGAVGSAGSSTRTARGSGG